MAETLYISGQIQQDWHDVACDAVGMTGSAAVRGWIMTFNGGVYDYDKVKILGAPEFLRLFDALPQALLYVDATTTAPLPKIDRLVPESLEAGGSDVTLHVYGAHFTPRSQILFNGGVEATAFVSTRELTTTIVGATATTPGQYPVLVQTAAPGGGTSQGRWFYILSPTDVTIRKFEGSTIWEVPAHV